MSIDFTQPVETRDGRKVNIYTTEHPDKKYPIVGAVQAEDGWRTETWTAEGVYYCDEESDDDLINVRPSFRHVRWAPVYADNSESRMFKTREECEVHCPSRIAIKRIVLEGKEGDQE